MRFGLFGGTFNPIHIGHLRASLEVKETFGLDTIYLIPSAIPPHKAAQGIVNAQDRFQMIRLAIDHRPEFVVSDVELDRPGPSYSIDTVLHFKKIFPEDAQCYLILGTDAFYEIDTWRAHSEFFDLVPIIIMVRPNDPLSAEPNSLDAIEHFIRTRISDTYQFTEDRTCLKHPDKQPIFIAAITPLDISATQIRGLIRGKKSIRFLVPDSVADYIETKGLYV